MTRVTYGGPDRLGDVMGEREVFYVNQIPSPETGLLSPIADSDLSARDGFTEFTAPGRAAIDTFTQEVAVLAADDFVPLSEVDVELRRRLEAEQARTAPLLQGLLALGKQQSSTDGRPSTSHLRPADFGDLDRA